MATSPRNSGAVAVRGTGRKPPAKVSPFAEQGVSGVAVWGGQVLTKERDYRVAGERKWDTYADVVTNASIVAAGVRYFLNIVAHTKWSFDTPDDKPETKKVAEFLEEVINDMTTPWRRVMRRSALYRFNGFGIQEWTAKRRKDGKIGLDDIESRPCHTIIRWEVDEGGSLLGAWQRSPQTFNELWLPRQKILYMVEDSLTDSPEGLGLFRHMVEPALRLKRYQDLEGLGFDRDLRGIPIGRVPYAALNAAVSNGSMTAAERDTVLHSVESFVKMQTKSVDTSIVLDSAPYVVETDSGQSMSGLMQYSIELLQGQTPSFGELSNSIQRLNREMARIIGVEHLLLGETSGSRSLSEDKSRNFYLTVNGALDEIADAAGKDVINLLCDLNGIKDEHRPKMKHSDVSFRSVSEYTAALSQMASAGAVLAPDDPAINDIREMLGLPHAPEPTPGLLGVPGSEGDLAALLEAEATQRGSKGVSEPLVNGKPPVVVPPQPAPAVTGARRAGLPRSAVKR